MGNLLQDFATAVVKHQDRVAIVDGKGREITFAQLKKRADSFACAWSAHGISPGDKVLLAMAVDADLYAALAALWSLGATAVLPEPAMGLAGLRHAARTTNVNAFCSSGLYGALKFAVPELWPLRHLRPRYGLGAHFDRHDPAEDEIALISFTSGTTGAPKAIARSHGFMSAQHDAIAPLLQNTQPERDLVAFPVFVLINIADGRTSVLPNWKMSRLKTLDPVKLRNWVAEQNISRALVPPSLCEKLATASISNALHTVFTGGGPVFPDILERLKAANNDLRIVSVYGSTEAEPIAHIEDGDISAEDYARMTSGGGLLVGRPVEEISVRIIEDEIQVAGRHVNNGYLDSSQDAENKVPDGGAIWHRTGDAGYIDDQERLWLLGRTNSQISLAGRETYPFSIEIAARTWGGVKQCALMSHANTAYLAIEGDGRYKTTWQEKAPDFGINRTIQIAKMPMDKRHVSKVDRNALRKMALLK